MLLFAMAWWTQALARVKAPAHPVVSYRLACSCPLLVEVCTVPCTDGHPKRVTDQLLLVRFPVLAQATAIQATAIHSSMLSICSKV